MKKRNREQIIEILQRVDRSLEHYQTIKEACEYLGISRSSFYRWQKRIHHESSQLLKASKLQTRKIQGLEDQVTALTYAARGELACPTHRKYMVESLQNNHGWSQRRACRALKQNRSTQRYKKATASSEAELLYFANHFPIFGGRKVAELTSQKTGEKKQTLEKRFYRKRLGATGRPRKKIYLSRNGKRNELTTRNKSWGCDLTESHLWNGKRILWLAIIDEHTRECICLEASHGWRGRRVSKKMKKVLEIKGIPTEIKTDNASLWQSWQLKKLTDSNGIRIAVSSKGSPWENGKVESFFASFHREFLSRLDFLTLCQAKEAARQYMELYNSTRPHQALQGLPPSKFKLRPENASPGNQPQASKEEKAGQQN